MRSLVRRSAWCCTVGSASRFVCEILAHPHRENVRLEATKGIPSHSVLCPSWARCQSQHSSVHRHVFEWARSCKVVIALLLVRCTEAWVRRRRSAGIVVKNSTDSTRAIIAQHRHVVRKSKDCQDRVLPKRCLWFRRSSRASPSQAFTMYDVTRNIRTQATDSPASDNIVRLYCLLTATVMIRFGKSQLPDPRLHQPNPWHYPG